MKFDKNAKIERCIRQGTNGRYVVAIARAEHGRISRTFKTLKAAREFRAKAEILMPITSPHANKRRNK